MNPSVVQFKKLVEPWLDAYDRIIVSAIGVNEGESKKLLLARILLAPGIVKERTNVAPLSDGLLWGQLEVKPWRADEFDGLLADATAGFVSISSSKANLPMNEGASAHSNFYSGYHPAYGNNQSASRLPTLVVEGGSRGAAFNKILNGVELDWHLRSLSPPYFDLADLHTHFRLAHPSQMGDQSAIELMVAPPVSIDLKSQISNKKANLYLLASKGIHRESVTIGYRSVDRPEGALRERLPSSLISWNEVGGLLEGRLSIDVGEIPAIQCFLSYAGTAVHQWWVADPTRHLNIRHAIYSAFDADQSLLRRLLIDPKPTKAREFEDGVAMLFGMIGFAVTQHGRSQELSNAPDIVAITPTNRVAVVECTVGLPDEGDQLAKVLRRTEAIRRSLAQSGWPNIQLLPVVVTTLPEAEITSHKALAEKQGVFVICKETILSGLEQVRVPSDSDQFFTAAINRLKTPVFRR